MKRLISSLAILGAGAGIGAAAAVAGTAAAAPSAPSVTRPVHRLPDWLVFKPTPDAGQCGVIRVVGTGWQSPGILFCQDGTVQFRGTMRGTIRAVKG